MCSGMVFRAHVDDPIIRIGSDLWSGDTRASELASRIRTHIDTPQELAGTATMDGRSGRDREGTTRRGASVSGLFEIALGKATEAEDEAGWLRLIDPKE